MSTEGKKIWMDGELVDFANARVHVLSHSLHYGVGVFEGIRAYPTSKGTMIFRLADHVRRMLSSAHIYRMVCPYTAEEIARAIVETQAANDFSPSYIRPILYRGDPALGVKNLKGRVSLAIAAIPAKKYLGANSETGVRAKISPFRKPQSDSIPSFAKASGNYLNSYLAGIDAAEDGYEEAILLDHRGFVAEGTGENIFLVRENRLYTPGLESDILLGVTRRSVQEIASDLGYPVIEKPISVNELLTADEVFFSGTYAEIAPVREIGHSSIGQGTPGPVTKAVMNVFYRVVHGEEPKYASWLTPVPTAPRAVARPARR
ncbi:MAG: branched-chain amino acid transaminase [Thermoplasmata archaeon]|nr:branched-chain amino acid transaminase [Thermoplasmata archaeon]MCI4358836.1 branched-chain amino acid transaminase [Thermoplasmata archaeon]